jgi:glycosyltransferase involved in cell wall biosynthesis
MYSRLKNKTLMIVSNWGYPFGGGEEYLYQTGIWGNKYKMNCYWVCFSNANNKPYDCLTIEDVDGFKLIRVPGGFNEGVLYNWIKLINPDVIHHQGNLRKEFYNACSLFKIEFITGIHFWNGVINLNEKTRNVDIIENSKNHTVNQDFIDLYNSSHCTFYSVSRYVSECVEKITGKQINHLAYSGSLKNKYLVENNDPLKNKYVTIINIHKMKGGDLLLFLLQELKDIPFMVVRTEYQSEELDKQIETIINERNNDGQSAQSIFLERTNDVKFIYSQTRIFLAPSLVDETFCRTVNEAMMNGIPVITSGQGNIKYLVDKAGIILPLKLDSKTNIPIKLDMIKWKNTIKELYNDKNKMTKMIIDTKKKYEEHSEQVCEEMFMNVLNKTIMKGKDNNIMIMAPWCDQGLGIQSRNYYNILKNEGYRVHIFSMKPYNAKTAIEMQKNPGEWAVENIYYSPHDREHIKDSELLEFIAKYNIGKCIIPETCWFRIFEMAKLLRDNNVKCYAIPNIEIVRKDEITKHKYFYKILCNNFLCQSIFNNYGVTTTEHIGYGILNDNIIFKQKKIENNIIKFLFIGGMNAFSRKHVLEICEGFVDAHKKNENLRLSCTIQKTNLLEVEDVDKLKKYTEHPGITFIQEHLSYDDIIKLYYEHHVSIQVSKHEGLGLGFYEALATGTPVISLDTSPHNELIKDGVNGWLIPCYYKEMTDNKDSFIKSAYFDPQLLTQKILEICSDQKGIYTILKKLFMDYNQRLAPRVFIKHFMDALN